MATMEGYKFHFIAAVGFTISTLVSVSMIPNAKVGGESSLSLGELLMLSFVTLASAIFWWVLGTKKYIDFRFQELEKEQSK